MCIIGLNPSRAPSIDEDTLRRCNAINKDGMGIAYTESDGLKVYKTLNNLEGLIRRYKWTQENNRDVLLHFRLQTVGMVDLKNCHPFYADENVVFAHNGTFSNVYCLENKSDTRAFRDQVLAHLQGDWLWDEGTINLLEYAIGHNRVVFMDDLGRYQILNEESGVWANGTWWSNTGFMPRNTSDSTSGKADGGSSEQRSLAQWADEMDEADDTDDDSIVVYEDGEFVRHTDTLENDPYWEEYEINPHGCFYKSRPVCYGCLPEDADDDDCHVLIDDGSKIIECEYCGQPIGDTNPHAIAASSQKSIPSINQF